MTAPVESKVYGGAIGAGSGAALTAFVLWVLGVTAFGATSTSDSAMLAIAAVPAPVAGFVGLLLTAGGSFGLSWLAKHTPRLSDAIAGYRAPENTASNPQWVDGSDSDLEPSSDNTYVGVEQNV